MILLSVPARPNPGPSASRPAPGEPKHAWQSSDKAAQPLLGSWVVQSTSRPDGLSGARSTRDRWDLSRRRLRVPRLDHPFDHPDDPSISIGSRLDRRGIPREQARSRLEPSGSAPSIRLVVGRSSVRIPPRTHNSRSEHLSRLPGAFLTRLDDHQISSGTAVHPAQDDGAALPVDPAILNGGGQLSHHATAPPPSLHMPHATPGVGQPLALQLHVPGPVELVEPHRHGHGRDEPEHRTRC
jgi:hypothetical protein